MRDFFRDFGLAVRSCALYPAGHVAAATTLQQAYASFEQAVRNRHSIDFSVAADSFQVDRQVVYRTSGSLNCPVGKLYREGIRLVRIGASTSREDMTRFVAILSRDISPDSLTDALVTMLWEAEFPTLSYDLAAVPVRREGFEWNAPPEEDLDLPESQGGGGGFAWPDEPEEEQFVETAAVAAEKERLVEMSGPTPNAPAPEILWESAQSPRDELSTILAHLLLHESDPDILSAAAGKSVDLVFSCTREGDAEGALRVFTRLRDARDREEDPRGQEALAAAFPRLASPEYVECLKAAATAKTPPVPAAVYDLLAALPEETLAALIPEAAALADRYPFGDIFRALAPSRLPILYGALDGAGPEQAAFLLELLAGHRDAGILAHLGSAVSSSSASVRRQALEIVGDYPLAPRAAELLDPLLHDPVAAIREGAVTILAGAGSRRTLDVLWRYFTGPDFALCAAPEQRHLLLALASHAQAEAVPVLQRILNQRSLLGRSRLIATQEAAMDALRQVRDPAAAGLLEQCARSGPRWMRNACRRGPARPGDAHQRGAPRPPRARRRNARDATRTRDCPGSPPARAALPGRALRRGPQRLGVRDRQRHCPRFVWQALRRTPGDVAPG